MIPGGEPIVEKKRAPSVRKDVELDLSEPHLPFESTDVLTDVLRVLSASVRARLVRGDGNLSRVHNFP